MRLYSGATLQSHVDAPAEDVAVEIREEVEAGDSSLLDRVHQLERQLEEKCAECAQALRDKTKAERKADRHYRRAEKWKAEALAARRQRSRSEKRSRKTEAELKKLQRQTRMNHENSSLPSSADRQPGKVQNNRVKTGRPPGAKKGEHVGARRPRLAPTEPVKELDVPQEIKESPDWERVGTTDPRLEYDVTVTVTVTPYVAPIYRNRVTGEIFKVPFPSHLANEVNYGPGMRAAGLMMMDVCNVSQRKTAEFLREISDGRLVVSKAWLQTLSAEFKRKAEPELAEIRRYLENADVLHADTTGIKVNGKLHCVAVNATNDWALFGYTEQKGHAAVKGMPLETSDALVCHDRETTFESYGTKHQWCLAHLQRDLKDVMENESHVTWAPEMRRLLAACVHNRKRLMEQGEFFTPRETAPMIAEYQRIVALGKAEYEKQPPASHFTKGKALLNAFETQPDHVLLFLEDPRVPTTNNLSERLLRTYKRKQAQAVTMRAGESVKHLCAVLSVVKTEGLQKKSPFSKVREIFMRPDPGPVASKN